MCQPLNHILATVGCIGLQPDGLPPFGSIINNFRRHLLLEAPDQGYLCLHSSGVISSTLRTLASLAKTNNTSTPHLVPPTGLSGNSKIELLLDSTVTWPQSSACPEASGIAKTGKCTQHQLVSASHVGPRQAIWTKVDSATSHWTKHR